MTVKPVLYCFFLLSLTALSCSEWFEYSPYDTDVNKKHLNNDEAKAIETTDIAPTDTIKFAVISDVHDRYDDLSDAIRAINRHHDLEFVICSGDITNSGLAQQFEWYVDEIEQSDYPFITMIGNHDYRSNGLAIHRKIFGSVNFAFIVGGYKLVLFDNTIWENENRTPRYEWLSHELSDDKYDHIVLCHIPPWEDQMIGSNDAAFCGIVKPENTILCLHGHTHNFEEKCYNGIHTVVSDAVYDRTYCVISLIGKESFVEKIHF